MNKLLEKIIAILLIFVMAGANLCISVTYAIEEIELAKQNTVTQNANVEFNAYFGEGEHEKVENLDTTTAKIFVNIKVKNVGYLKNGVIRFENANFEINGEIKNDNIQSIDKVNHQILLKQLNNGSDVTLEIPISISKDEYVSNDHFAKVSKARITGTYVDGKGKEKNISKEIQNKLSWKGTAEAKVTSKLAKYIPYKIGEHCGVMLQTKVDASVIDSKLPVQKTQLHIQAPQLNEINPTEVKVIAKNTKATNGANNGLNFNSNNYIYDAETGITTIEVENTSNNIAWLNGVQDEYLITYIYEGEEIYNQVKTNGIDAKQTITGIISVYNGEETNLPIKEVITEINPEEKIGTIADINMEVTPEIEKGQIYANYDVKNKKETKYNVKYISTIVNSNLIDKIELTQKIDRFVTQEEQEGLTTISNKNYTYNKRIIINQEVFKKILGEDGVVELYNIDKTKIGIINKETEAIDGNYILDISSLDNNQLYITTSKPVTEGEFIVDIEKGMKQEIDYGKEQMKSFVKIKAGVEETASETTVEASKEAILKEPTSKAGLLISKTDLTTVLKNEDVRIRATLFTSSLSNALYKNPTLKITLPSYISQIDIKKTDILMANGLKVKGTPKITTEDGAKVIYIQLEGMQQEYTIGAEYEGTIIELNTDLTVKTLTPSNQNKVTMEYTNENEILKEKKLTVETKLNFIAPEGVVAANRISNYAQGKNDIMSISEKGGTATIDTYAKKRTVTISGIIINNYQNSISDIAILGRIPVKDNQFSNLSSTFSTTLNKVVTVKGMKDAIVYYSDNAQASADLNNAANGWSTTAKTSSKSYLIVTNNYEMPTGATSQFSYDVEIPENLAHNNSVYETYEVHYNNLSSIGKMPEVQASSIMEMATGQGAELTAEISPSVETIRKGQIVKMRLKVTNTGSVTANNVKVSIPRPKYVSHFLEARSIERGFDIKDIDTYEKQLGNIEKGKSVEIDYYIQLEEQLSQDENSDFPKEVINTANITVDGLNGSIPSKECKLEMLDGEIRLEMHATRQEAENLKKGDEITYFIRMKNIGASESLKDVEMTIQLPEGMKYKKAAFRTMEYENEGEVTQGITFDKNTNIVKAQIDSLTSKEILVGLDVEVEDYEGTMNIIAKATANGNEHYSNIREYNVNKISLKVSELTVSPKYVKEGKTVKYSITIKNDGAVDIANINIIDILPKELEFAEGEYKLDGQIYHLSSELGTDGYMGSIYLPANQSVTVNFTAIAKMLSNKQEKEVQNGVTITGAEIETIQSNKVTNVIEPNEELRKELAEQNNGQEPSNPSGTARYKISGTAWIDSNKNGKRESEEEKLAGVEVLLLNKSTNAIVKDVDTKESKITTTNAQGQYTFSNLEKGEYLVVFAYDSGNYSITTYKAKDVDDTLNSDAIDINITLDGERRLAGITDVIRISDENVRDIDIGVYTAQKFDLRLDKYISKITLTTPTIGTKVYEYNNSKAAKIEVLGSSLGKSNIVIEYKIVVTNEGAVPGYAKKIVDYLPEGLGFNTELNKDWYLSDNGNLYNASLANTIINPGESKEITLIATKKITQDSLGNPINNNAEIYESYNEQGLRDIDSTTANKAQDEDDMSNANVILSIVTGTIIKYTAIALGVITIFGFGIYEIKRRVIGNRKI